MPLSFSFSFPTSSASDCSANHLTGSSSAGGEHFETVNFDRQGSASSDLSQVARSNEFLFPMKELAQEQRPRGRFHIWWLTYSTGSSAIWPERLRPNWMALVADRQEFFLRLGKRIRELRRECGRSQEDMISHGFSARHWQQIEAGRPITVSTLLRICAAFDTYIERLVRGLDAGIYRD